MYAASYFFIFFLDGREQSPPQQDCWSAVLAQFALASYKLAWGAEQPDLHRLWLRQAKVTAVTQVAFMEPAENWESDDRMIGI